MNPFATKKMSEGYASARPPVHRRVVELMVARGAVQGKVLDVGCGSGLSTRALAGFATSLIGVEPVESMVQLAGGVMPEAGFVVARAELLPMRDQSIDWISAAGALNYVDLPAFFAEAVRVLRRDGGLAVYDFSPGRTMRTGGELAAWFESFIERYPWAPSEAVFLDPKILAQAATGFELAEADEFAIAIELTRGFYVGYMMTEANVAYAMRQGIEENAVRSWIEATLPIEGWGEIVFNGYWAILKKTPPQ